MAERVEVNIERFVPGGWGMGHDVKGLVFVRGAAHGETVRGAVIKTKGQVRFAVVDEVVRKGPGRARPDCEAHPTCGGCALLDLSPAAEAQAKEEMLRDALTRIGRFEERELIRVEKLATAPERAGARMRASVVIDVNGAPAFHEELSNRTVARGACRAMHPALDALLGKMFQTKPWPPSARVQLAVDPQGRGSAAVFIPNNEAIAARMAEAMVRRGLVNGAIAMSTAHKSGASFGDPVLQGVVAGGVRGGPYFSDAATFTQATEYGAQTILAEVLGALKFLKAERGRVLELYAGAGHLSLGMAAAGAHVVAVESDRQAITWLRSNASRSPMRREIEVKEWFVDGGNVVDILGSHSYDALVIDPPRTGVKKMGALLGAIAPKALVMVSCDLATGARDLRAALDAGYSLERLVPIDAFPRTHHLETVATLKKARF